MSLLHMPSALCCMVCVMEVMEHSNIRNASVSDSGRRQSFLLDITVESGLEALRQPLEVRDLCTENDSGREWLNESAVECDHESVRLLEKKKTQLRVSGEHDIIRKCSSARSASYYLVRWQFLHCDVAADSIARLPIVSCRSNSVNI